MCKEINILKSTIKFSLVGFFFILDNSYAVDSESWSSMGFGIKLPYSFKLDLEQSLRLKDNSSSFKQTFTETIISYNMLIPSGGQELASTRLGADGFSLR